MENSFSQSLNYASYTFFKTGLVKKYIADPNQDDEGGEEEDKDEER